MDSEIKEKITSAIIELQDKNGCWNVLDTESLRYPELLHYEPIYNATLWTLILLADIQTEKIEKFVHPLTIISKHFYSKQHNIFTIGKSHFPIPCLNGNMIYLHSYFEHDEENTIEKVVDFFLKYQRFDDGNFKTPKLFPYCSNRSCYGSHTCYWGVIKLFKGLSFIPKEKRTKKAKLLMKKCIEFILLHEVCYSSHNREVFLHTNIKKLTFPNMYQSDYLEILWLLKREKVNSVKIKRAYELLANKMNENGEWKLERQIKDLIIPIGKRNFGNSLVTDRAKEVVEFYQHTF